MNAREGKSSIAVVGLGNMGSGLAAALLAREYPVTVWNRTASRADPLIERGARLARDVVEAARLSEVLIICVADHSVIESLLHNDAVAEALKDKCLVQLGIVTPAQALENAEWAQAYGIGYLEGSILGVPDYVVAGTATIVCSGSPERYAELKPMLEVFGASYHFSSSIGAAYQVDRIFYPFGYGVTLGFIQGAAMAKASGFSVEAYTNILIGWTTSLADRLAKYGDLLDQENYSAYQGTLSVWREAYAPVMELCQCLGVNDTLPKAHLAMLAKAIDEGYETEEILAVYKTLLPE